MNRNNIQWLLMILMIIYSKGNICHGDCVPNFCNGITKFDCIRCPGNQIPTTDGCKCKLGYFDKDGNKCSFYSDLCEEGNLNQDGDFICTKCYTDRFMNNGKCERTIKNSLFFSKENQGSNSLQNIFELLKFGQNNCRSIQEDLNCESNCSKGFYFDGQKCQKCGDGCQECDSQSVCTKCYGGSYLDVSTCQPCSYGCSKCTDSTPFRCSNCLKGFYFDQKNDIFELGSCKKCDSDCQECRGPGTKNCIKAIGNKFVKNMLSDQAEYSDCPQGCTSCFSENFCTKCEA